jgi:hypothetical protein
VTRALALAFAVVAAGSFAGSARADIRYGVADDAGKYADDGGGNFFGVLNELGATENRVTLLWDPTDGNQGFSIAERAFLDRALPIAKIRGVNVVLSVYPAKAKAFAVDTQNRIFLFGEFLKLLAETYPDVTTYIVGNEPNQPRFMQPQFVKNGKGGWTPWAAMIFQQVMATSYDALKGVNPEITVAGIGLSPRGNDNPKAKNNISRSPVRFIAELAKQYRRSFRTKPLMDAIAFHPYPSSNDDPSTRGYGWPNAGIPNLNRIKQAIWDGFHGTPQPVFAEAGDAEGTDALTFVLDEYGRQAQVISSVRRLYTGKENVQTVTEAKQSALYVDALRAVSCDPSVTDFFLFHLVDESDLDRFQSGLLRADWTKRPAFDAVQRLIAADGGRCGASLGTWRHVTSVVGAAALIRPTRIEVTAKEEARVRVAVLPGAATAANADVAAAGVKQSALIRAGRKTKLKLDLGRVEGRSYTVAVRFEAALNPDRSRLLLARFPPR